MKRAKLILVMMSALLVFVASTQVAEGAKVYIGKSRPVYIEVYNTFFGFRVGDPIFEGEVTPPVTIDVDTEWWSTDVSVKQRFLGVGFYTTHNIGAVREIAPGDYVLAEMETWLRENVGFEPLGLSDIMHEQMELYVAVDLEQYLAGGGEPLLPEMVIPDVMFGMHPLLPGYQIGLEPIIFDPALGWINPAPYSGEVTVLGGIYLTAPQVLQFSFDWQGCIEQSDPDWRGPKNPEYPYQHKWTLNISDPGGVQYINDIDIEGPIITPGYIEVVPPENWESEGVFVGRYGYEANPGAEISAGGGSLGIDWRVNGKVPTVVPGTVTLTWKDVPVSIPVDTLIVEAEPPEPNEFEFTFDHMGYVQYGHPDWVGGPNPEYPYQHSWELNITQWGDPLVVEVTDVEVEGPVITPGYVQVIPPPDWSVVGITLGRYGYENNTGTPIVNEGKYTGFRVKAKVPQVEPGHVYLTQNGEKVTETVETMVVSEGVEPSPFLMLDTFEDWDEALGEQKVREMLPHQWDNYMDQWNQYYDELNEPYPDTNFMPPELLVYDGPAPPNYPDISDDGLVMAWGPIDPAADGDFASAWQVKYGPDPDLTNCLITVTVTAPQFGFTPPFSTVTQVSLGLQDSPTAANPLGAIRSWFWNCGPAGSGAPITWNVPTTITIDTSKVGVGAATPTASGYMNNPGFSLKTVQWVIVDENANWVGGSTSAPAPGGFTFMWNYWHWLMVTPKTTVSKGYYSKWSQPPVVIDENADRPVIIGWDERSDYHHPNMVADDWLCEDDRPVTDIHWWGSYIGWTKPYPPPIVPIGFHLGIWTDDPCSGPGDFSHPNDLIWENYCYKWVWNFAGYDRDPRLYGDYPDGTGEPNEPGFDEPMDTCFQFNQLLSEDEWFYQEPNDPFDDDPNSTVYWLSVAPIYNPGDYDDPNFYPWGWKTRRPEWNDDAVRISSVMDASGLTYWPPIIGSRWASGTPIEWPDTPPDVYSWDVSFELTTNEPGPPNPDLNNDGIVNFYDVAILANNWLAAVP